MTDNRILNEIASFFKNIDYERLLKNANGLLNQIKDNASKLGVETTKMMLELYYVMMSDSTSKINKLIIGAALGYQFLPNDFFNKEDYGILGYLDNAATLYWAYKKVKKSVTPEIKEKVEKTIEEWKNSIENFTIMKQEEDKS